jgi:RNA polymerase sigma-70 factor (ECF subfamily)
MIQVNERELVTLLSKGNINAFNALFREYSKRLYRFAYGYLKSEAEAEELVQEVFTRVWEKRSDLKEDLSFKSFLFTISFNIIKKHFRARTYNNDFVSSRLGIDVDTSTTDKITSDSLNNYIRELVEQLPKRRKEIFIKSRFEGESIKEIAQELDISHKTVENQLTEALRFLRNRLKKEGLSFILLCILI